MRRATHRTIADVTNDLERWSYNTAVAHCMEQLNLLAALRPQRATARTQVVWDEAADALLSLLAPLTPHVTAELWEQRHPGRALGAPAALAHLRPRRSCATRR